VEEWRGHEKSWLGVVTSGPGPGGGAADFFLLRTSRMVTPTITNPERDQFGLGGVKAKDVIFAVHPDVFDQESLYSIQYEIDSKKLTGSLQPFAD